MRGVRGMLGEGCGSGPADSRALCSAEFLGGSGVGAFPLGIHGDGLPPPSALSPSALSPTEFEDTMEALLITCGLPEGD